MAILIKDAHDFIRSIIKKNKGGFVSPGDIDIAVNRGVSDWMSAVIYKYKQTGKFDYDHLFVKKKAFTVSSSTGTQSLGTADYVEALTVYLTAGGSTKEGTIYNWDEFLEIQNSSILSPNVDYPAATIFVVEETVSSVLTNVPKIQFSPVPTSGNYDYTLVYMRKPAKAVFAYESTSGTTGNIVYKSVGSVDIDIDDRYFTDIMTRALMYLGISLKDGDIASAEAMKDNNQRSDER
jgi:hypothetical protein